MTKETKIGLLVGLAFIVLFAIILSEKGGGPRAMTTPQFTRGGLPAAPDAARRDAAVVDAGRVPVDRILPEPTASAQGGTQRRDASATARSAGEAGTPTKTADARPRNSDDVVLPNLPESLIARIDQSRRTEAAPSTPARTGSDAIKSAAVPAPDTESTGVRTAGGRPLPATGLTIENAITKAAEQASRNALRPPPADGTAAARPVVGQPPVEDAAGRDRRQYVVRSGDTLTSIARRSYGSSTPAAIERLYRANAKEMRSRHALRIGQVLFIPASASSAQDADRDPAAARPGLVIPESDDRPQDRTRTADADGADDLRRRLDQAAALAGPEPARSAGREAVEGPRWYVVKPKDTLWRIARRELGSERRINEIVALNRTVLKGRRDRLLPGQRLRLPPSETVAATEAGEGDGRRGKRGGS